MPEKTCSLCLPVTVLVVTKNEQENLPRCLAALQDFQQVIVVDSYSRDKTADIARDMGALLVPFVWNGRYPKKRQWALEHVPISTEWVMFVDADEIVTDALKKEISQVIGQTRHSAFFVFGQPVYAGKELQHGRWNNKIVLFRNRMLDFPDVKDEKELNMGEIEGHYQPHVQGSIAQLEKPLVHFGPNQPDDWHEKHARYAEWMVWMINNGYLDKLYGTEKGMRYWIKRVFLNLPFWPLIAFADSFILKRGFLDGRAGFGYAMSRASYYRMIQKRLRKECVIYVPRNRIK